MHKGTARSAALLATLVLSLGGALVPTVAQAQDDRGALGKPVAQSPDGTVEPFVIGGTLPDSDGIAAVSLDGSPNCSGSIIDNYWILTAKHCVRSNGGDGDKYDYSRLKVRVKSVYADSGGGVVGVALTKSRDDYDLALIKLNRSANAEPVRMATKHSEIGATTYVFGYGANTTSGTSDYRLRRGTERVVDNSFPGILTHAIDGKPCHGDSGGPLFKLVDGNRYQIGVVSRLPQGDPTNCSAGRTVYSSVPNSLDWIETVMRDF
ncbi:trypsin-like serine protease [Streptomyces sp. P17]|uniref:S1 family peptidase n=1 Tax=Streptomyces sp. P17 TaxID=3074716 RepID=UPI0028F40B68|nr:trypsin-like serine protease [Streptomyces sp. P17]MDT9700032.1 trypsin-like serine protease [Streptomyces sp. P17]